MGRGTGTEAGPAALSAAARRSSQQSDPLVERIVSVLAADVSDRHLRDRLLRSGLMISVPSPGLRPNRVIPSAVGEIVAERHRLPTEPELRRLVRRLDGELRRAGVSGDVAGGSYSYTQPRDATARAAQERLISNRRAVEAYVTARDVGHFTGVRVRTAQARAAQQKLIAALDRIAGTAGFDSAKGHADRLREGVISVADVDQTVRMVRPAVFLDGDDDADAEALRIGLGVPSTRQRMIRERDRRDDTLRRMLDRTGSGERVHDGEHVWSEVTVDDYRVKRAAFGCYESADRIAADYMHQVIIELDDGTVGTTDVKRAHSDLEPSVDVIVDDHQTYLQRLAQAELLERRARAMLGRWARRERRWTGGDDDARTALLGGENSAVAHMLGVDEDAVDRIAGS